MSSSAAPVSQVRFGPITVRYDERVIVPRPWTLAQSEWAAQAATHAPDGPVLELCCGAGHIGLAVAALSGRALVQVDASDAACELAALNADAAGLTPVVEIRRGHLLEVVAPEERYPVIVADPPYIASERISAFDDPALAIDGGPDGLELAVACCRVAAGHLHPDGVFSLQLGGTGQWEQLAPRVPAGLEVVEQRSYGPDRAVVHLKRA